MDKPEPYEKLKLLLRNFVSERDWDKFHNPKNLCMALVIEAAELAECFQWLTPEESSSLSKENINRVADEAADIFIYLTRLTDILGIDLWEATYSKIEKNAKKYPAEVVTGKALKYTEF